MATYITIETDGKIAYQIDGENKQIMFPNSAALKTEVISDTDPEISGVDGTRYICGEVETISIIPPESGMIDVLFISGETAAELTLPEGVKFSTDFDPDNLEASTVYEISILDGVYGAVLSWT
jgi:hypothetical protein